MGKKPIVSVTYENERISIKKNSLPYLKCALRLSRVVHGSIYGRFVCFYIIRLTVFSVYKAQDIKVSEVYREKTVNLETKSRITT